MAITYRVPSSAPGSRVVAINSVVCAGGSATAVNSGTGNEQFLVSDSSYAATGASEIIGCDSSGSSLRCVVFEAVVASGVTWGAGTWTVHTRVATANMNLTITAIYICRINSSGVSQATIASSTGLSDTSWQSTGTKTFTVTGGAAQTPSAGDRFVVVFALSNGAMSLQSVTLTENADGTIDVVAPFTASSSTTGTASVAATKPSVAAGGLRGNVGPASVSATKPSVAATGIRGIKGTAAVALAALTLAGTGSVSVPALTGTASVAATKPALAATGKQTYTGTASVAVTKPAASATGKSGPNGTASVAATKPTLAASGRQTHTGTASVAATRPAVAATGATSGAGTTGTASVAATKPSLAASGKQGYTGTANIGATKPAVSASGKLGNTATAAVSASKPSLAASGKLGNQGTVTVAATKPSLAASGKQTTTGTGAVAVARPALTATGSTTAAGFSGTGAVSLTRLAVAASGKQGTTGTASVSATRPAVTSTGRAGTIGTARITLPAPQAAATGGIPTTGVAVVSLPAPTPIATGEVPVVDTWRPLGPFIRQRPKARATAPTSEILPPKLPPEAYGTDEARPIVAPVQRTNEGSAAVQTGRIAVFGTGTVTAPPPADYLVFEPDVAPARPRAAGRPLAVAVARTVAPVPAVSAVGSVVAAVAAVVTVAGTAGAAVASPRCVATGTVAAPAPVMLPPSDAADDDLAISLAYLLDWVP